MGHYDEQREEEARASYRFNVQRQASCNHRWTVYRVNEYAEPMVLQCPQCGALTDVKQRPE